MQDEDPRSRTIHRGTPESMAMVEAIARAMRMTAAINRLGFDDTEAVNALFAELTGRPTPPGFKLIPPFYSEHGINIRVGTKVFINQNCTLYDIGGIEIGHEVMIGPNCSLLTSGHALDPVQRRAVWVAKPITIGRNVWLAAGVTVLGGVSIGENSVIGAGSVVTKDVPAGVLAVGSPARVVREVGEGSG
ncbi:MAG: bacterial transferase hexapeptide family protein [Caulobacteraceae bacterium]|nr:bacterial transferase hexapeptide family protein [Caulobacteraceae bacterium]